MSLGILPLRGLNQLSIPRLITIAYTARCCWYRCPMGVAKKNISTQKITIASRPTLSGAPPPPNGCCQLVGLPTSAAWKIIQVSTRIHIMKTIYQYTHTDPKTIIYTQSVSIKSNRTCLVQPSNHTAHTQCNYQTIPHILSATIKPYCTYSVQPSNHTAHTHCNHQTILHILKSNHKTKEKTMHHMRTHSLCTTYPFCHGIR